MRPLTEYMNETIKHLVENSGPLEISIERIMKNMKLNREIFEI